jgi:hypothetical protein
VGIIKINFHIIIIKKKKKKSQLLIIEGWCRI